MKLLEKLKAQKVVHGIIIVIALVVGTLSHKFLHEKAPVIEEVAEFVLEQENIHYKFDSEDRG